MFTLVFHNILSKKLLLLQRLKSVTMSEAKVSSVKGGMVQSNVKLNGKTVVITGCNTGIGLETVIDLAKREAKIIMACRNLEKAEIAKERVIQETKSQQIVVKHLDLSSLDSVRKFADDIIKTEDRLDILINNAGVMACPPSKTEDGFELQMGTNHLGHFLLTILLLDLVKKSAPSRIVVLSSTAHEKKNIKDIFWDDINLEKNYNNWKAYQQSKLMNVMFGIELNKRLEGTGVTVYNVHPGVVATELGRHLEFNFIVRGILKLVIPFVLKTPIQGAQTSIFCAIAPEILELTGSYFKDCHEAKGDINPAALDSEKREKLWRLSEEMVGLKEKENMHQSEDAS